MHILKITKKLTIVLHTFGSSTNVQNLFKYHSDNTETDEQMENRGITNHRTKHTNKQQHSYKKGYFSGR